MMSLSNRQVEMLLDQVAHAAPDSMHCDGCFEQLAEYADAELLASKLPASFLAVESHLRQCDCCRDEYAALLDCLRDMPWGGLFDNDD